MTAKEMVKLLKSNGFVELSGGNGSHRKLMNPVTKRVVIVPYHSKDLKKDLKKGLEQAILKQAGLN